MIITKDIIPILLALALLASPLAIWIETTIPLAWQQRIVIPTFEPAPQSAPLTAHGTVLPPLIDESRILTAADNPVILTEPTRLAAHTTLSIEPGVTIVAAKFASLEILGTLIIAGTADNPVSITTNEQHPDDQVWSGIIFRADSAGRLQHLTINHASPAISCLDNAVVDITTTTITHAVTGVFTTSPTCRLTDITMQGVRDGLVAVGVEPNLTDSTIYASRHNIKTF